MEEIYLGSHVGLTAPEYYLGSVKEALFYGSNTFMFYTGAPQNSYRKPLEELRIDEGRALLKEHGVDESKLIVHAPYIINGANVVKEDIAVLAKRLIIQELERTAAFHVKTMVLHPGAHVGAGASAGIAKLAAVLDEVLEENHDDVIIALETMAGKGSEIGKDFKEIRAIIDGCKHQERLGVCLDTCHVHDAGYDVSSIDALLDEFDGIIGLDRLRVIHLNDSKNPVGSHKDRHENIGYGYIGFEALARFVHSPRLIGIPIILETPYVGEHPPYKEEIAMLRENVFSSWRD